MKLANVEAVKLVTLHHLARQCWRDSPLAEFIISTWMGSQTFVTRCVMLEAVKLYRNVTTRLSTQSTAIFYFSFTSDEDVSENCLDCGK